MSIPEWYKKLAGERIDDFVLETSTSAAARLEPFTAATRYNIMMFITTKREEFANDQEVRAMLWIRDDYAGINRHYDIDNFPHPRPLTAPDAGRVKDFHRRKVDISALITEVVVNPKAAPPFLEEIAEFVTASGHTIPVRESALARYSRFLPF